MARFVPDHAGIQALKRAPALANAMRRKAEQAKAYAEVIAPVDTGHYRESFFVTDGVRGDAVFARLNNNARSPEGYPYCVALEFGNSRIRAQRIIQRSIDALRTT